MRAYSVDKALHRATISVSVPPLQREAFYAALIRLKQDEDAVFVSASALIVKAVIERAAALAASENPSESAPERTPA